MNPRATREVLEAASGAPLLARETRGGDLFYRLHYRFEIQGRNGWWLSGAAAVVMLVSMLCGVIIHKRIFKDFFTFRPKSSPQRAWLDAHVALAVLLLPFHLVITYTGLVPIMSTVMPWAIAANYADSPTAALADYGSARSAYSNDLRPDEIRREPAGEAAPLIALERARSDAERHWNGAQIGRVNVFNPFDRAAVIEIARHEREQIANRSERVYFAGDSGAFLGTSPALGPVTQTSAVMYGLHMVRFADPILRWIMFVVGVASSAMIAAGLVLWVVKRTPTSDAAREDLPIGYVLVERLNVAGIVGLPFAMAAFFWANRLLPVEMAERASAETRVFFAAWLAMLVLAALRPRRSIWLDQLWLTSAAFGGLPLLNAATTQRGPITSLASGDLLFMAFDLCMIICGAGFAFAAMTLRRRNAALNGARSRVGRRSLEGNAA